MRKRSPLYLLVILILFCFIISCKNDSPVNKPANGRKKELNNVHNENKDLIIRDDKINGTDSITLDSVADTISADSDDISKEQISHTAQETNDRVYEIAETLPAFPNGETELRHYLNNQVQRLPNVSAYINNLRTMVSFIVDIDGSIISAKVAKSCGQRSFDEQAVNIVLNMPKWIPATNEGHNVRMKYTLPVVLNSKN